MTAQEWASNRLAALSEQLSAAVSRRDMAYRVKMECENRLRALEGAEQEIASLSEVDEEWARDAAKSDGAELAKERQSVSARLREATAQLEQGIVAVLQLQGRANVVASHAQPDPPAEQAQE